MRLCLKRKTKNNGKIGEMEKPCKLPSVKPRKLFQGVCEMKLHPKLRALMVEEENKSLSLAINRKGSDIMMEKARFSAPSDTRTEIQHPTSKYRPEDETKWYHLAGGRCKSPQQYSKGQCKSHRQLRKRNTTLGRFNSVKQDIRGMGLGNDGTNKNSCDINQNSGSFSLIENDLPSGLPSLKSLCPDIFGLKYRNQHGN
uniref:Uncharacterized protein n=2 Tax=Bigelowiella natans TaxID=227086 RepID=A0A7S2KI52_BIGNA|mmetsp:Transcript_126/g.172  ORF Transcript_126/g.172 Transcript_126/m.172 type:complete len:199 (+) Transcript_126:584-1180(+)